ncbi:MAG: hypothetical protein IIY36_08010 [Lachnospiraceae bacterium]|nr:hypothetical protein [Lachnospiraceae bacterium]
MGSLIETYQEVLSKANEICDEIRRIESEVSRKAAAAGARKARIAKLEEQLGKIGGYMLQVRAFQETAKRNMDSMNVLTIEAPSGYRVNLNRLKNWAAMIDPEAVNDPYAQRVYAVAKCDELFLQKKQEEYSRLIEELRDDPDEGLQKELQDQLRGIREDCGKVCAAADALRRELDAVLAPGQASPEGSHT